MGRPVPVFLETDRLVNLKPFLKEAIATAWKNAPVPENQVRNVFGNFCRNYGVRLVISSK